MQRIKKSTSELKQLDNDFQIEQQKWLETNSLESWHKMFFFIQFACENSMKKRLKGIKLSNDELDDLILEATTIIMLRYKRPQSYKIMYLPAVAQFAAIKVLYDGKRKFHDRCISLESWRENHLECYDIT